MKRWTLLLCICWCFGMLGCLVQPPKGEPPVSDGGTPAGEQAFVISMWEESGSFGLIDTKTRIARRQIGPVSNDAVARYYDGYIFIVNRLTHDNIQVMDTSNWSLVKQYSVGPRSNPQDIAVLNKDKAYISRLADGKLLIVAPLTGKKLGEIDLSALAETSDQVCTKDADCDSKRCLKSHCARDGIPELAQLHLYKEKLFVAVQRLDRNKRFDAKDKGLLAVIDTHTDKLIKTLPLLGANPVQLVPRDGGRTLYVSQVGRWLNGRMLVLDGLIEVFDLDSMTSKGVLLTEKQLGGNISSFAISTSGKGFVIRSNERWQTELLSVDITQKTLGPTLASSDCVTQGACFGFFQVASNHRDEIYLVDRNIKRPGIRVFDGKTGTELTKQPIDMGLPPSFVLFFP